MVKHKPNSVLILWLRSESLRLLGDNVLKQSSSINKTFNECFLKSKIISFFVKVLVNWKKFVSRMMTEKKRISQGNAFMKS